MSDLCDRIIEAHGGRDRWLGTGRLMASLSMGGSTFASHLQPRPLRDVEVTADLRSFRLVLSPYPRPGETGVVEPSRVCIQADDGSAIAERCAPGTVTRSLRHWLVWDSLDVLFVAGVMLWQAMLFPWLLTRSGVIEEPLAGERRPRALDLHLPGDLPLIAYRQIWHAGATGLVERADYALEAYAGWLRVSHMMSDYEAFDGLVLPTRQTLYPCLPTARPWKGTRLAWLALDDMRRSTPS